MVMQPRAAPPKVVVAVVVAVEDLVLVPVVLTLVVVETELVALDVALV